MGTRKTRPRAAAKTIAKKSFMGAAGAWLRLAHAARTLAALAEAAAQRCEDAATRGQLDGHPAPLDAAEQFREVLVASRRIGGVGDEAHRQTRAAFRDSNL
jgi:hypothetical protein